MSQYETPNMMFPSMFYYGPQPIHTQLIQYGPHQLIPLPLVHFGPQVSYVANIPKERVIEYQLETIKTQMEIVKRQIELGTSALKELEKQKEELIKAAKQKTIHSK